jgi:hypothetical protein
VRATLARVQATLERELAGVTVADLAADAAGLSRGQGAR